MNTRLAKIIFAILLLLPVCANATDITFTSSGSIVDGNVFVKVYVENDGTIVNMSGGQLDHLATYDASIFNMSGGQIIYDWSSIYISSLSTINVSGGTIDGAQFTVSDSAFANFSGGNVTADVLKTYDTVINITGGNLNFDTLYTLGAGELNISGGLLNIECAIISNNYTITISGYDFNYNQAEELLTGYLLDENPFTIKQVSTSEYARFNLIPEPISLYLFGFGLLTIRFCKK
jgi:hypothetical protein